MGYFYIDESIHEKHNFIISSIVYSETDLNSYVKDALQQLDFNPLIHEFKSSIKMENNKNSQLLRREIRKILYNNATIGLAILPIFERDKIAKHCIECLMKIIKENKLIPNSNNPHKVYFDEGIKSIKKTDGLKNYFEFYFKQDSKLVRGIQVADLSAHYCSMMLLGKLGVHKKKIYIGEESGYPPSTEISLDFEIFATIRYKFFVHSSYEDFSIDQSLRCTGLHISRKCSKHIKKYAKKTFAKIYFGCIH